MGVIRAARPSDVPEILALVQELAEYERELDAVVATEDSFHRALFSGRDTPTGEPAAFCLIADHDGAVAGLALWFLNFSTWQGRHGVYLEDLYVRPRYRGAGYGKALLSELASICVERGYGRLEWAVLNWNTPAIDFYRSQRAVPMDEWTVYRVTGRALRDLAGQ